MSARTVMDLIIEYLVEERKVVYVTVVLSTAALYDHITTLDEEIEYIWLRRSKITVVRALFLINRCMGEVVLLYTCIALLFNTGTGPNGRCSDPMKFVGWGGSTVVWSMQGIMSFRISSMYRHNRAIIATLSTGLATEITAIIVILAIGFSRALPSPIPVVVPVCRIAVARSALFYWIPVFCFELLMLSLSVRKALEYSGGFGRIKSSLISSARQKPLVYVLFRDSITFPFLSLIVCTVNFVVHSGQIHPPVQISVMISVFMARLLGCRLLLNLREAYYGAFDDEFEHKPVDPIFFAHQTMSTEGRNRD